MKCEIEFMPVGDASRAGDSIIVRYGEETDFKLIVIDGGTLDSGENLVKHLRQQYGHDVIVEHAVLTHADADHASGMRELFKELHVNNLWMHIPWKLAPEAINLFANKNWTSDGLTKAIKQEYDILREILDIAWAAATTVRFPFQGAQIGPFTVLSPTREHYLYLLPQFEKTPDADQNSIEAAGLWVGKATTNMFTKALESISAALQTWVEETWEKERLRDGRRTSASNESSVILYADVGDGRILLTGDAGVRALSWAVAYAKVVKIPLQNFSFVQIPHHGSRSNVGPTILNELLGPILLRGIEKFSAYVSAPVDDSSHPRKMVLNAFTRRGGRVIATQGKKRVHRGGFAARKGYISIEDEVIGFSPKVEDYDD
jgi:beta-lactamase superfamily II metal-dependent hydrolase